MTRIGTVRLWLLAGVLFGGAFALQPSLSLALFDFPSFRIGLYQSVAAALVITSLPLLWRWRHVVFQRRWLLGAIATLSSSLFIGLWLTNSPFRSLLYTASLLSLIVIGVSAGLVYRTLNQRQRRQLITIGLWGGVVCGAVAIGQLVIASLDATAFGTLCRGCAADVFGFVRINGFAAEPQFFASSLLPALFLAFWQSGRLARINLFLSSVAIALTFSRGAFVAIVGALLVYALVHITHRTPKALPLRSIALMMSGVLVGFGLLISSATLRHHDTPHITYNTTVSMIEHLSLGVVSLPQRQEPAVGQQPAAPVAPTTPPAAFTPAGYVEASSSERLSAADLALMAWSDTARTVLFGVGLGNLGTYLQHQGHAVPTDQTVYIMYILLLSNIGSIGILPLLAALLIALWHYRRPLTPWAASGLLILAALTLHFWFFGSLINAVHCFAWIGVLLYNYRDGYAKKF